MENILSKPEILIGSILVLAGIIDIIVAPHIAGTNQVQDASKPDSDFQKKVFINRMIRLMGFIMTGAGLLIILFGNRIWK